MKVPIVENVLKLNDEVAALNRVQLKEADVLTINLIGSPGCGKTALLETTLRQLADTLTVGVLVGDLATTRDADRLARWSPYVVQINTGKSCHLEAHQIRQALTKIDLAKLDILVIENVGNLVCPVSYDLGEDFRVGMFSVCEGDDKAAKHPQLVHAADLLVLNKTDLLAHVAFDPDVFRHDVAQLNPQAPLLEVSAGTDRIDNWLAWLASRVERSALQFSGPCN